MLKWIVSLVGSLGYAGIAILMAVENVVLPLPSELIMPLAGFESASGRLTLFGAIVAGTFGSVVGALPVYVLARSVGQRRLTRWLDKHGRWLFVRGGDLESATARFERHGAWAVLVSQILPGVRGLIALPAGFARMNVLLFLLMNLIGTVVWCTVLAVGGHVLGANFEKIHQFVGPLTWVVLAAVLVGGGMWLYRRRHRRGRRR